MAQVEIIIAPGGGYTTTVEGMPGPSCRELTRPLLDALGGCVAADANTPEYEQEVLETLELR